MKHAQTYWIHRHRQGFYLNAPHSGPAMFYDYVDAWRWMPTNPVITIAQVCIVDTDVLTALEAVYKAAYSLVDGGEVINKHTAEVYASEFMTLTKAIDEAEQSRNRVTTQATVPENGGDTAWNSDE